MVFLDILRTDLSASWSGVEAALGEPARREADDAEPLDFYDVAGREVDFEYTAEGGLKRLNAFPRERLAWVFRLP